MPKESGGGDESVQFSLTELLKLEDERVVRAEEQRAAERARIETERSAEAAAGKRAVEIEATDRRRRELDDLARREAMQTAIVEQARLEVDVRSRAEERELERRHEIELARLRREGARGGFASLLAAATLGGAGMMLLAGAWHFGVTAPASARRVAEIVERAETSDRRASRLARERDDEHRARLTLEQRLVEAQPMSASLSPRAPKVAPARGPRPPVKTPSSGAPVEPCLAGDPLCPTIAR